MFIECLFFECVLLTFKMTIPKKTIILVSRFIVTDNSNRNELIIRHCLPDIRTPVQQLSAFTKLVKQTGLISCLPSVRFKHMLCWIHMDLNPYINAFKLKLNMCLSVWPNMECLVNQGPVKTCTFRLYTWLERKYHCIHKSWR